MWQLRREGLAKSHLDKSHSAKSPSAKPHSVKSRPAEPGINPVFFVCVDACVFVYTTPDIREGRPHRTKLLEMQFFLIMAKRVSLPQRPERERVK